MIHIYHSFDRNGVLRVVGTLVFVFLLMVMYMRLVIYPVIPAPQWPLERQMAYEPESSDYYVSDPSMTRITNDQLCVPQMSAEAPALPQNQSAYNWMAEHQPDLIGVPEVGTPLRATLGRDLTRMEMQDLADVIEIGSREEYKGRIVVYFTHREPEGTTVVAKIDQLDSNRPWAMICDPNEEDCSSMGVTAYTCKNIADQLPPITCPEAFKK